MLRRDKKVYILPDKVYHYSPGDSFSEDYYLILKKLIKKHKKYFKFIYTTIGIWNTFMPVKIQKEMNELYHRYKIVKLFYFLLTAIE
jgi:hypothetical protein